MLYSHANTTANPNAGPPYSDPAPSFAHPY